MAIIGQIHPIINRSICHNLFGWCYDSTERTAEIKRIFTSQNADVDRDRPKWLFQNRNGKKKRIFRTMQEDRSCFGNQYGLSGGIDRWSNSLSPCEITINNSGWPKSAAVCVCGNRNSAGGIRSYIKLLSGLYFSSIWRPYSLTSFTYIPKVFSLMGMM